MKEKKLYRVWLKTAFKHRPINIKKFENESDKKKAIDGL